MKPLERIILRFAAAIFYACMGASVAAVLEPIRSTSAVMDVEDAWDAVRISLGAVFGATAHAVSVWLAGGRVDRGKRAPRIAAGALAAALAVAALQWQNASAPLSLIVLVAGLAGWLGSQLMEMAGIEARDGVQRVMRAFFKRLGGGDVK